MVDSIPTDRRQRFATGRRLVILTILLLFASGVSFYYWLSSYSTQPGPSGPPHVRVVIPPGSSFTTINRILVEKRLIHDDVRFSLLARLKGYADSLQAGEFELQTGQTPLYILRALSSAKSIQHRITIAEGLNAFEIATILEENNWCTSEEFLALVRDREFLEQLGFGHLDSIEGYLYPDTYYFTRFPPPDAEGIIHTMIERFSAIWQEVASASVNNQHEVVILASIVEKETGAPAERARIASVFRNRLERGMKLQSDPTVIYGITNFNGNLTKKDLKTRTPYNTYVIKGLPVGPISNPGREALKAVLSPADEKFLYFVSKNDGTHYFSTTLREHNRAVRKYQR